MQNPTFMPSSPISDKIYTLIAEGTQHFPRVQDINACQKCVRANSRKRVVVANKIETKKFFILAEYPELNDESGEQVFHKESSTAVILNLLEKLGISSECHHSFALKCISSKHYPDEHLSVCVLENMRHELRLVAPETLFCFGPRAFFALNQFIFSGNGLKMGNSMKFQFEKRPIDVYVLPTAQELNQFPTWRSSVWAKLMQFHQKKKIDS